MTQSRGTRSPLGSLLAAVGLVGLVILANAEWADAHAVLLRSIPAANQMLSEAPDEVRLLFSEPVDIVFSGIRVTNEGGESVDGGDAHVDRTDDHQLVVSLQPGLPSGTYTVSWRSLSTIDVHPDEGEYSLFVGVPVAAETPQTNRARFTSSPETTLARWWFYLAASLFGGVLGAWKFVLSGVLVGTHADARAAVHRRAHRLVVFGGVLLVVGTLYAAVAQAAAAADTPVLGAFGQPLADLLLRGRFAAIWWPRIALEVTSLLLIVFADLDGLASDCAVASLPAVLLTSSLTSHGAALPEGAVVGIAIDWLHIMGATLWVGGLVSLLTVLPVFWGADNSGDNAFLPRLVARFSRFALIASALVVISGVLQASLEVGSWSGLVETIYGQMVLVKIFLLCDMLVLAGFNTWRGRRRYPPGAAPASTLRLFRRGVRAELGLGVLVLVVAAVLTGTPPDRAATPPTTADSQAPIVVQRVASP